MREAVKTWGVILLCTGLGAVGGLVLASGAAARYETTYSLRLDPFFDFDVWEAGFYHETFGEIVQLTAVRADAASQANLTGGAYEDTFADGVENAAFVRLTDLGSDPDESRAVVMSLGWAGVQQMLTDDADTRDVLTELGADDVPSAITMLTDRIDSLDGRLRIYESNANLPPGSDVRVERVDLQKKLDVDQAWLDSTNDPYWAARLPADIEVGQAQLAALDESYDEWVVTISDRETVVEQLEMLEQLDERMQRSDGLLDVEQQAVYIESRMLPARNTQGRFIGAGAALGLAVGLALALVLERVGRRDDV